MKLLLIAVVLAVVGAYSLIDPCRPSPCGPNSQCRYVNGHAVCSCQDNYSGAPPGCRLECVVHTECAQDRACANQKCFDPCPGSCGVNARCVVANHIPSCSCPTDLPAGDPFVRCAQEQEPTSDECVCQTSLLKYYSELSCLPVKSEGACCPNSFDCQAVLSKRPTDKCHLKGVQYAPGARISSQVVGDPCVPECICNKFGSLATLRCVNSECPELLDDLTPPNCVPTYTPGKCCSTGMHCDNDTTATTKSANTCEYAGKSYVRGQQFYPEEAPCKKCICQEGFDGTLNGPWCTDISCGIEIHYGDNIHNGCAPVFFGAKGCCPIGWRCPASGDSVVSATGKQSAISAKCQFGELTLNVGDSVSQEKSCQVCKCTIPPHVSCVQTGYC